MEQCGFSKDEFHFIKRKGRIITQHRLSQSAFSFFLKKDILIDSEAGDFRSISMYEIKRSDASASYVVQWSDVLESLHNWLHDLPQE